MRRLSFIWMILIPVLVLVGCKSKETDGEPEKTSFNAVVLEVNGDILLVEPEEDAAERKSCDRIQVGLSGMEESRTSELLDTVEAGDIVCVTYNGEIMETYPAQISAYDVTLIEAKVIETEERESNDMISLIRVNGELYYDTGRESTINGRCGVMDGEIDSTVAAGEIPMKEHQSNFGTGYGFQYAPDDVIEVYIDEQWRVFEKYQ